MLHQERRAHKERSCQREVGHTGALGPLLCRVARYADIEDVRQGRYPRVLRLCIVQQHVIVRVVARIVSVRFDTRPRFDQTIHKAVFEGHPNAPCIKGGIGCQVVGRRPVGGSRKGYDALDALLHTASKEWTEVA